MYQIILKVCVTPLTQYLNNTEGFHCIFYFNFSSSDSIPCCNTNFSMLHLTTAIIPGVIEVVVFKGHLLHIVPALGPEKPSENYRFFFTTLSQACYICSTMSMIALASSVDHWQQIPKAQVCGEDLMFSLCMFQKRFPMESL